MVTKGIVEEIINIYQAKVRLPVYDGFADTKNATPSNELTIASICNIPNIYNTIAVGDIVYVAFEDNDLGNPVILGQLYKEEMNTLADIKLNSANINQLAVNKNASLPQNTSIGSISSKEIAALSGVKDNIQNQIDINLPAINFAESERQKSKNLFNGNWHYNYGMTTEGHLGENSNENTSHFIEVAPNTTYTISGVSFKYVAEYTSNNESSFVKLSYSSTFTTSATTHYIRFTIDNSVSYTNAQLEEGSVATSFQKFNGEITHNGDVSVVFAESERQKSKNLFNAEAIPITSSYVTYDKDTNTFTYTVNSTIESTSTSFAILKYGKLKPGTYTMSFNTTSTIGNTAPAIVAKLDEYDNFSLSIATKNIIDGYVYLTFTLTEETNIGLAWYYKAGWIAGDAPPGVKTLTNLQLEEGSIATNYQSYNGEIIHEKQLPKITTLWTNPNPSNDFSSQTITLANDNYDYAIMICNTRTSELGVEISFMFEKGDVPLLNFVLTNEGSGYATEAMSRRVDCISATSYQIYNCYYSLNSQAGAVSNTLLIPYKVLGIKMGE